MVLAYFSVLGIFAILKFSVGYRGTSVLEAFKQTAAGILRYFCNDNALI